MHINPVFTDSRGKPIVITRTGAKLYRFRQRQAAILTALVFIVAFGAIGAVTQIELTTQVKGILPTANGGTANGFFTVAGPTTSAKTFTFPNASSTVLTSNAAVTVAQGGSGVATLTAHAPIIGEGAGNFVPTSTVGTTGQCLIGQTGADPIFGSCGGLAPIYSEVPSGTINGANTTFTLANTPASGTLALYKNGQRQTLTNDYTLATNTITYLTAPVTGDTLLADYTH